MSARRRNGWTLGIVSVALFMVVLDNLVVSVALPTIHRDLGASIQSLEWTVNAYVLAYAVLLLTGAALGDRFGRKRMFLAGLSLFTLASACRRARPQHGSARRRARSPGRRRRRRDAADADAAGGGVPQGSARDGDRRVVGHLRDRRRDRPARGRRGRAGHLLALDLLDQRPDRAGRCCRWPMRWLTESRGPYGTLDLPGLGLASTGAFGIVFGLVRAQSLGWTSTTVLLSHDRRRGAPGRVRRARAAHERADAADVVLRQALLRRHERGLAEHVLRHVRVDLLPLPVHAERARKHPPAGRAEAARVDGRLDGRRAPGRRLLRALRQPPVHVRRASRCRRARSAGWRA